jgi:hypothetical protein
MLTTNKLEIYKIKTDFIGYNAIPVELYIIIKWYENQESCFEAKSQALCTD